MKADTRKLDSYEAFRYGIEAGEGDAPAEDSLQGFAARRRTYLLNHAEGERR